MSNFATNQEIRNIINQVRIIVLGPGRPEDQLGFRREICANLQDDGYNAFVMEDEPDWEYYQTHLYKFKKLLRDNNPILCVAIYSKKGSPLGVTFEIGYIARNYEKNIKSVLKLLTEKNIKKGKILTSYIHDALYQTVSHEDYSTKEDIIEQIKGWTKARAFELKMFKQFYK
ncbi:hypothetical protein [Nitrosopumilus ureiphilus]|uniref:Uncharacterized protein n=1 Tax=Nitrosopumilus ureiphilus TaxID=1470067 RepID=A0A7D5R549_9ARCH|nr:hypothetical protein [Nitrosopumilus ureiphilus]QLH05937.1 hypothetical protein C5F50_01710 [Nitrosopumilus ureiphilus]